VKTLMAEEKISDETKSTLKEKIGFWLNKL
jgi:hypothetical protein